MRRSMIGLVGLLTAAASVFGGCSSKEKNAAADVAVTTCSSDPGGGKPHAEGTIQNNSSKDSGYAFRIAFKDAAGNKVSDGAVTVGKVLKGQSATWKADGASSAKGDLSCEALGITRTAVP